ncbi:MAG: LysM peptidoglycan-binding domain-containing protein [Eubacteriales bacterium]|nr:LysM peptidoglycan-binding domain-containing protein [Eubacteriales bacterium]
MKPGDTLYNISQVYGIPVSILMQTNRILNPYHLKVGQEICIPNLAENNPNCNGILHKVVEGDTLYMITRKYNISLDALMKVNSNLDPYDLRIGMTLCIPIETAVPTLAPQPIRSPGCSGFLHKIVAGDTFYLLAKKYNLPLETIMDANPHLDPYNLRIGSMICVPVTEGAQLPEDITPPPEKPMTPVVPVPPISEANEESYFIRIGDNLEELSQRLNLPKQNLMKANPILNAMDFSIPGTRICIPK